MIDYADYTTAIANKDQLTKSFRWYLEHLQSSEGKYGISPLQASRLWTIFCQRVGSHQ